MRRLLLLPALALIVMAAVFSAAPHATFADQRDFTLTNGSASVTIVHVYVSPASAGSWQEDILGQDVLNPGDAVTIHFGQFDAGQCVYDIRVDGNGGEQGFVWGVDLCATTSVTFS